MNPHRTILCLAMVVCLVLSVEPLFAQSVTTAAMNGKVTGRSGEALVGVNILAVHNPSGTRYGTSTRQDGRYTLPGLRTGGPYTVTASMIGYQRQTRTTLYLQLSQNLDLNFAMVEEAVQAGEVTVLGERSSVFNASRTGAAYNVTRDQLDKLPTLSRNFSDYFKTSPYVSGDGNVLGRNSKYNNIQIDGANYNDMFGLGTSGTPAGQGPTRLAPMSLDAIEEFQIVASPFDVRQSGFTGAGINVITRSGTNASRGSMFYYGRNEGFAGKSPDTLKKKLDGFTEWVGGMRVGGAVIEDHLFYFLNAEFTRRNAPIQRSFGNQTIGTNAFTASADSLQMLSNHLKSRYGYEPGSFATVPQLLESDKLFTRLDYNLSESHKLIGRWSYLRASEDNSPSRGRSLTDIYFENGRYRLDNQTHSFAFQLSSIFGNSSSNELILGYVDQFDNPVFYGQPFPTLYIATRGAGTTDTRTQNLVLGAEEFRHRNELGQKVFEITNNFSLYLPDHTLTIGARVDFLKFRNLFIADNFGAYAYSSIARFLQDLRPDGAPGFGAYTFRYSATANPLQESNWGARQYGMYVQDEWTVSSLFKLTAGVRIDIPTYPDKPNYNYRADSTYGLRTDTPPKSSVAFSPRLGFNLAMDEERTMQIRGGAGVFYGRFPYVWVGNQYANTGVDFITITTAPTSFNPDPFGQTKVPPSASATAEVNLTARNFKAPSIIRTSLAVDYKLPLDLVATIEGVYSITQNDVYYENINLKGLQDNTRTSGGTLRPGGALTPGGRIVGENREVWGILRDSTTYTTQWVNNLFSPGVFLVKNTNKGSNANVIVQVQRNVHDGLNGGVAYTLGFAKDINSGNSTTASSGWRFNPTPGNPNDPKLTYSQYDRRHRISANLSYRHDWGTEGLATTIGVFYGGQSGRPFSYMVSGDVNGDGRSDNDLAYIPRDANDIILVSSSGAVLPKTDAAYTQLFSYIEADDYLKANKGKISERSGPREPWSHQVDLHLGQDIPTFGGQKIEFSIDILNVLNLLNGEWGWMRTTGINQTVNLLTFRNLTPTAGSDYGKPRYTWSGLKVTDGKADPFVPDNIPSRWQAQFGIRYTF